MKKKITKLLFALSIVLAFAFNVSSQRVSEEKRFVQTHPDVRGHRPQNMSDNGHFIVLNNSNSGAKGNTLKLWDTQLNEVTVIGKDCYALDVTDDGKTIVGTFLNPDFQINNKPVEVQGFYRDGKWTMADFHPEFGQDKVSSANKGNIYNVSPDGRFMGGHLYISKNELRPAIWDSEGRFVRIFEVENDGKRYTAQARAMSSDGTKCAGWTSLIDDFAAAKIPAYWNKLTGNPLHDGTGEYGWMQGMNNDGSIALGYNSSGGLIIKDDGTIKKIGSAWFDVSENGIYVGAEVYSEKLGLIKADDYFTQIQGFEPFIGFNYITAISDNGEYMCVMCNVKGWMPYFVKVSDEPLPSKPNNVLLLGGAGNNVNIAWELPQYNGYNPIGYNVYRDGIKVNVKPITTLTYTDTQSLVGNNCYTVTSVYKYTLDGEELESKQTNSQCFEVISPNSCYSPKQLSSDLIYNRTVNLKWRDPSANFDSKSTEREGDNMIEYNPSQQPKLMKYFNVRNSTHVSTNKIYIHCLNSDGKTFDILSMRGELLRTISVADPTLACKGLTFDGEKFYTTVDKRLATVSFGEINGAEKATVNHLKEMPISTPATRLTYLPFLDGGKGGFETGDYIAKTSYYLDREMNLIEGGGIPDPGAIMGVTYHENTMYVAKREGEKENEKMYIYLYDIATNEPTGRYIEIGNYKGIPAPSNPDDQFSLWGISVMTSSEDATCLTAVYGSPIHSECNLLFIEIGKSVANLEGYNVYRNDKKISGNTPVRLAAFTDKVLEAGDYSYTVTAVFDNGCESEKTEPANIKIEPINPVNMPTRFELEAVRNSVVLSWETPKAILGGPQLVGYNIFKDGVKINSDEEYITGNSYTCKDIAGEVEFAISAFYNNSALSDEVKNKIDIRGFNPALPPTELKLSQKDRGNVTIDWKTPAIGNYDVKKWCTGLTDGNVGLVDGGTLYVATKWNSEDLIEVFDYTLTDVEFYPEIKTEYTIYVHVDNDVVIEQKFEPTKVKEYNLVKLQKPIAIVKGKSLMIAIKATHAKKEYPFGSDKCPNIANKGDLMSTDGQEWVSSSTYGKKGNWSISARLMPYTTIPATKIEGIKFEANSTKNIALAWEDVVISKHSRANESIFNNREIVGYNVYRNETKINTAVIEEPSFTDTSADLSVDNCYTVEAIFTEERISPKSEKACTFGYCFEPTLSGGIVDNYPELKMSTPEKVVTDNKSLSLYNKEQVGSNVASFTTDMTYLALIHYQPIELKGMDGYKIKSIDAYIHQDCKVSVWIKQGNKVTLEKAISNSDISFGAMNGFDISNENIIIDENESLMFGLKVIAKARIFGVGLDAGPANRYKGDVVSRDNGATFLSLAYGTTGLLDGNWNIEAHFEKTIDVPEERRGYNIYRNDLKINDEPITDGTYIDKTVEDNTTYIYHATAIWNTNCESKASAKVTLTTPVVINTLDNANIRIYPNPVKDILNIEGDCETVRFYNSRGQECRRQKAEGGRLSIDVSNWAKGIYFVEATATTGEVSRNKVVIK